MMKLCIDADGCPVAALAAALAREHGIPCVLFCDTAHQIEYPGAQTITVSKGRDSADFALINAIAKGDLVVTQDYGLAAMSLARGARVLHQDGKEYTAENIEGLLFSRHAAQKARRAGQRLRGAKKREPAQDEAFSRALAQILAECRGD